MLTSIKLSWVPPEHGFLVPPSSPDLFLYSLILEPMKTSILQHFSKSVQPAFGRGHQGPRHLHDSLHFHIPSCSLDFTFFLLDFIFTWVLSRSILSDMKRCTPDVLRPYSPGVGLLMVRIRLLVSIVSIAPQRHPPSLGGLSMLSCSVAQMPNKVPAAFDWVSG